eukprot:667155-Pelagomonas_calceolata.AAC.1
MLERKGMGSGLLSCTCLRGRLIVLVATGTIFNACILVHYSFSACYTARTIPQRGLLFGRTSTATHEHKTNQIPGLRICNKRGWQTLQDEAYRKKSQEKRRPPVKTKRYDKTVHGECQVRKEPRYWKSEIKRGEDQKTREHI